MSLDRRKRSIRMLQTDRKSEDRLQDKRTSSHATSETLHDNVYLASFG